MEKLRLADGKSARDNALEVARAERADELTAANVRAYWLITGFGLASVLAVTTGLAYTATLTPAAAGILGAIAGYLFGKGK